LAHKSPGSITTQRKIIVKATAWQRHATVWAKRHHNSKKIVKKWQENRSKNRIFGTPPQASEKIMIF
jgi:hypothetical protein